MMFALWSPGNAVNRPNLKAAMKKGYDENIRNPHGLQSLGSFDTVCADGEHTDEPFICRGFYFTKGNKDHYSCSFVRPIHVYSFDGEKGHAETQNQIIKKYFPHVTPNISDFSTWEYIHSAVVGKYEGTDTIHTFPYFK
jgi:hypothetical protein